MVVNLMSDEKTIKTGIVKLNENGGVCEEYLKQILILEFDEVIEE
jgi:hypothetical protein